MMPAVLDGVSAGRANSSPGWFLEPLHLGRTSAGDQEGFSTDTVLPLLAPH
jgi:hypothetical protein